jgi:hypothetical protein
MGIASCRRVILLVRLREGLERWGLSVGNAVQVPCTIYVTYNYHSHFYVTASTDQKALPSCVLSPSGFSGKISQDCPYEVRTY